MIGDQFEFKERLGMCSKCVMDNGNTGLVELDMIKTVLMKLGEKLDEETVMNVLKGMADDQGMIKYNDVINKVLEGYSSSISVNCCVINSSVGFRKLLKTSK